MHYVCLYILCVCTLHKYMMIKPFWDKAPNFLEDNYQIFWGTSCKSEISLQNDGTYQQNCIVSRPIISQSWINNLICTYKSVSKGKANWICHTLCRNCLLRQAIEGKIKWGIEVKGRLGRRRRKLLVGLKEGRRYSHLMEEAVDRTTWRARFGRGFGPVVSQTAKWMNEISTLLNEWYIGTWFPPFIQCMVMEVTRVKWRSFIYLSPKNQYMCIFTNRELSALQCTNEYRL
jgi:hypothetical protein